MFKHYLTTALRNVARHKLTTAISVFGLTLGLLCLLATFGEAYLMVNGDRHFAKSDRIYLIEQQKIVPPNFDFTGTSVSWLLGNHLETEFPELEAVARKGGPTDAPIAANGKSVVAKISFVDAAFLRMFDLPFVAGDAAHALDRPHSVVIRETTAQQLFGTTDVVGRPVTMRGIDLTITGVIGALKRPSHLANDYGIGELVSFDVDQELTGCRHQWDNQCYVTYVLFPEKNAAAVAGFQRHLAAFSARSIPAEYGKFTFTPYPVAQANAVMMNGMTRTDQAGIPSQVLIMIVGTLIAATACINYANLKAAQIIGRTREIGLRQVLGAERLHLSVQHLLETGLQVAAAYAVAMMVLALSSPILNSARGFNVLAYFAAHASTWVFLAGSLMVVTLIASIYPTLAVLRIRADTLAQANKATQSRRAGARMLVGVQFGAVSLLLILALVIVAENRALREAGLEKMGDPTVTVSNSLKEAGISLDTLRTELLHGRGVKSVSATEYEPWGFSGWDTLFQRTADRAGKILHVNVHPIADDFFETAGVKVLAGRVFSPDHADDPWDTANDGGASNRTRNIVIDRDFATDLGWSPADAVGQIIYQGIAHDGSKPPEPRQIIGVTENKSFKIFSSATLNMYVFQPQDAALPLILLDKRELTAGLATIDAAWARLVPETPLRRRFMDDAFQQSYEILTTLSTAIFALAAFAFAIAAAGLVGMATYAVSRLGREIAIRKALGSTVQRALGLILWDFSKPVVIANVFAWPLAFVVARVYLGLFTTRITLTPAPFALGFLIALAMTWGAVGWHAWRAARVNPAEVLHYE